MDEAAPASLLVRQLAPGLARYLQEHVGADDIRFDEGPGVVDGAIDMGLRREVYDSGRIEAVDASLHRTAVGNIHYKQVQAPGISREGQIRPLTGIS